MLNKIPASTLKDYFKSEAKTSNYVITCSESKTLREPVGFFYFKKFFALCTVANVFSPNTWEAEISQAEISELKAYLVYGVSSRIVRAMQRDSVSKK